MRGPLAGVRVVEVAQFWFVPSAAGILADWGADVVKVEHPERGDGMRGMITSGLVQSAGEFNFMWEQPNRGKRSVGIDIGTPDGHRILAKLLESADVFLTNFLPDARRRLGIEVDDVRAINPKLIYVRGNGYGSEGRDAHRAGYDNTSYYARSGISHHMARPDGPGPAYMRPAFGDGMSGLAMAGGITAALFDLERTGTARVVDVSLFGTGIWQVAPDIIAAGVQPGGLARISHFDAPNPLVNYYQTADGRWLSLSVIQADRYWQEFCRCISRPDLFDNPLFTNMTVRAQNREACVAALDEVFAVHTLQEWKDILAKFGGAWDPVATAAEVCEDDQAFANGYLTEVDFRGQPRTLVGTPVRFDETSPVLTRAPDLGEHTDEVLADAGYSWDEIIGFKVAGAIL